MPTYNTAELRRQNRNRVFRYIYASETPVTKQDVAQSLNLSLPTVGQNLKELQEVGLLETQGTFDSTGGRKPRAIGVASGVKCSVGIMLSLYHIHIVCIDLRAKVIAQQAVTRNFENSDAYYQDIASVLENFLDAHEIDRSRLLGVGIALPGIPSPETGVITTSRALASYDITMEDLTRHIPYPCFVENDANAGGVAEWWNHQEHENMVYLFVQRGVGGAVLMDGVRYMGRHHHSGEFGHMCIVPGGQRCLCGRRGCLEAYCSTARISTDLGISREEFFEGLESGNAEYQKIWSDYLDHLAIGINNIHMVLDCDIVLGGVLAHFMAPYLEDLRFRLKNISSFETNGEFLKLSRYLSWSTCVGVALHFISDFIESI
ncbi:MAG: ROK family transcriptional regulator [Oscillospiraceae bacterium]|nr:ROK family transcriptional regulator [Oscillospiraceae bacterium]